jgi:pimeloyl-ACP methyl ester carboxylesterase
MKNLLYQSKTIFYRIEGNGPTVLLVHGFGEDGNVWQNQVDYLKDKFRLIIPDLPGSGRSEMIDDMSIEGLAEVIKKILLAETSPNSVASNRLNKFEDSQNPPSGGRGAFIGHSMGGYIALAFAEKYPELLTGLGLVHSSAFADSEEKKVTRRKGIEFIKQNGAFEFLKTAIPNLFSPRSKDEMPEKIDEFIQEQHNFLPEALVSYYEAMMQRPDRTNVLKNSSVPVLFIMGKYDNAIPIEDGMKQCHLPEKSYIHVLRASGHMGMMEEPETSNKALEEFLLQL